MLIVIYDFFNYIFLCVHVFVYAFVSWCTNGGTSIPCRGGFSLSACGSLGLNSGYQGWWQVISRLWSALLLLVVIKFSE